jgi:hypothetical protein
MSYFVHRLFRANSEYERLTVLYKELNNKGLIGYNLNCNQLYNISFQKVPDDNIWNNSTNYKFSSNMIEENMFWDSKIARTTLFQDRNVNMNLRLLWNDDNLYINCKFDGDIFKDHNHENSLSFMFGMADESDQQYVVWNLFSKSEDKVLEFNQPNGVVGWHLYEANQYAQTIIIPWNLIGIRPSKNAIFYLDIGLELQDNNDVYFIRWFAGRGHIGYKSSSYAKVKLC